MSSILDPDISQDIPRLEIPLHTLIELVPKPDGKMAETRISVDVDTDLPPPWAIRESIDSPSSPPAPTTGVWNAHTGTWSVPSSQLSSQLSLGTLGPYTLHSGMSL